MLDLIVYSHHRRVVGELLAEARAHPEVIGALLIGSLGRGNAVAGSDVDLLLLLAAGRGDARLFANHERHGVLVEYHFRDAATARAQLAREPGWCYAYLNSRTLHDPTGEVAALVAFVEGGGSRTIAPRPPRSGATPSWSTAPGTSSGRRSTRTTRCGRAASPAPTPG